MSFLASDLMLVTVFKILIMKKIQFIFSIITLALFLNGCDTNDNTFYNDVFVTSPDLVRIEASLTGYHLGDKIYVSSSIDRLLQVNEHANLIDIRQSTGDADRFNFSYVLERKINATDWEVVNVNPTAIDLQAGAILGGSFYYASAVYSGVTDSYEFRAGIPLLAVGEYRLSFGYNSSEAQIIEIRSESNGNNLFLNIYSDEANNLLNPQGYFVFNVI